MSLSRASPTNRPANILPKALLALWRHKKKETGTKHMTTVQSENTTCCAWVHALLHREEGDAGNTSYWYERAQQVTPNKTIEGEWEAIVSELLEQSTPR